MYTPPQNRSRVIICAWVRPKRGMFEVYIDHAAIAEFYPIGEREVKRNLQYIGHCRLAPADVETFVREFDQLFRKIQTDS